MMMMMMVITIITIIILMIIIINYITMYCTSTPDFIFIDIIT